MSKFIALLLSAILFNSQVTPPPPTPDLSADENRVKRLLVIYTDVGGMNLDWNADGSLILTGARDTLRLWDAETLEEIYSLKNGAVLYGVEFNADGERFLTWSGSSIRIWDTLTGSLLGTLSIDSFPGFRGVMWRGDQILNWLGGTINLWDGLSPENNAGFLVPGENFNSWPGNALWNHAQTHFLTWNNVVDESVPMVRMWRVADDFEDAAQILAFEHGSINNDESIDGAAWSPDETMIVSWSQSWAKVWDASNGALLHTLNTDSYLTDARWSPNSRYILVEDIRENQARIWDVTNGEEVLTIPGTAMWDTTGDRLLVGRQTVELLAVPTGDKLAEFGPDLGLGTAQWNPDGVRLLVNTAFGVQVWIIPPQDRCVVHALAPANLRPEPRTDANRADILPPRRLAFVIDQKLDADNFIWWQLDNELWVRSDVVEETGRCFNQPNAVDAEN